MFEKEIKFINDLTISKLSGLGEYISLEQIKSAGIHPAIVNYIEAEIDYLIYEDRQKLLKNSIFDYSGKSVEKYFELINVEVKKNKKFSQEYISKLVLHSVSFTLNYLTRPNWSIIKFLFDSNEEKSTSEIQSILNYLYYYEYLKKIILSYLEKKNLLRLDKRQLEELLIKINQIGSETNALPIIETAVKSLSDFLNYYETKKTSININSVRKFLEDKNFTEYLEIINSKYDEANLNQIVEPIEIIATLKSELERKLIHDKIKDEIKSEVEPFEKLVENLPEPEVSEEEITPEENIITDENNKETDSGEFDEYSEEIVTVDVEDKKEESEQIDLVEETNSFKEEELIFSENFEEDNLKTDSEVQSEDNELKELEEIFEPEDEILEDEFDTESDSLEFEELIEETNDIDASEKTEENIDLTDQESKTEVLDADSDLAENENLAEDFDLTEDDKLEEDFKLTEINILEDDDNSADNINEVKETEIEEEIIFEDENIDKIVIDENIKPSEIKDIEQAEEEDKEEDPFKDFIEETEALEKLSEDIEASKLNLNVPIGKPITKSSVNLDIEKKEIQKKKDNDETFEKFVELDETKTKGIIVEEDYTDEKSFADDKLSDEINTSLNMNEGEMAETEQKNESVEDVEAPEIDIADLLEHKKMTKIIEVVFDYDMEDFTNCIDMISECKNEAQAEEVLANLYRQNGVKPTRKEAELFKDILFDYFKRK